MLCLATAAVGTWVLDHGHAQASSCNAMASEFNGSSASALCARAVSSYLMGATLTIGSLVVLMLVIFAMSKYSQKKEWNRRLPTIPRLHQHAIGSVSR